MLRNGHVISVDKETQGRCTSVGCGILQGSSRRQSDNLQEMPGPEDALQFGTVLPGTKPLSALQYKVSTVTVAVHIVRCDCDCCNTTQTPLRMCR